MDEKRTEKQRMLAGDLYTADCPELAEDNKRISEWMSRYNTALSKTPDERHSMLKEVLGHVGAGVDIRPPFFCDYGYNISIGDGSFINFNCVVLDVVKVMIGNRTKIGSAVQILTADHPHDPKLRAQLLALGSGAIIIPGVSGGDDASRSTPYRALPRSVAPGGGLLLFAEIPVASVTVA